jgi:hypothetical protein
MLSTIRFANALIFFLLKTVFSRDESQLKVKRALLRAELFEFPEKDRNNYFLGISCVIREWTQIVKGKPNRLSTPNTNGVAIVVSLTSEFRSKRAYVENCTGAKITHSIAKEDMLVSKTMLVRVAYIFLLLVGHMLVFPWMIFSKNDKRNLAVLPRTILGFCVLASFFEKNKCGLIYLFYIWHSDTNLIESWFSHRGIKNILVPLQNPLSIFSKGLNSKSFVAVLPYQVEEYREFYNLDVQEVWPVESHFLIGQKEESNSINRNEIAVYSHGGFAREKLGHPITNIGDLASEVSFYDALKPLIDSSDYAFTLYMHPKEKSSDEIWEWSCENYRRLLGKKFRIADRGESTYSSMGDYHLAIGSFSSVLFERQAMGFRTLIYAKEISGFPLKSSPMNDLVAQNKGELREKLEVLNRMKDDSYNENYGRYSYY